DWTSKQLQTFIKQDRERIRLLSGSASRDPDSDFIARTFGREQLRKDIPLQAIERFAVAKESRNADQKIAIQRIQFAGVASQAIDVIVQVQRLIERQPPLDPPRDGIGLVVRKIDAVLVAQELKYCVDAIRRVAVSWSGCPAGLSRHS